MSNKQPYKWKTFKEAQHIINDLIHKINTFEVTIDDYVILHYPIADVWSTRIITLDSNKSNIYGTNFTSLNTAYKDIIGKLTRMHKSLCKKYSVYDMKYSKKDDLTKVLMELLFKDVNTAKLKPTEKVNHDHAINRFSILIKKAILEDAHLDKALTSTILKYNKETIDSSNISKYSYSPTTDGRKHTMTVDATLRGEVSDTYFESTTKEKLYDKVIKFIDSRMRIDLKNYQQYLANLIKEINENPLISFRVNYTNYSELDNSSHSMDVSILNTKDNSSDSFTLNRGSYSDLYKDVISRLQYKIKVRSKPEPVVNQEENELQHSVYARSDDDAGKALLEATDRFNLKDNGARVEDFQFYPTISDKDPYVILIMEVNGKKSNYSFSAKTKRRACNKAINLLENTNANVISHLAKKLKTEQKVLENYESKLLNFIDNINDSSLSFHINNIHYGETLEDTHQIYLDITDSSGVDASFTAMGDSHKEVYKNAYEDLCIFVVKFFSNNK